MRYIDEDKLYEATDAGKDIFRHYYPEYDFGKYPAMKVKIRASEKTASTQISYYKNIWRITDFGNQSEVNSLPGVQFVRYMENLNYYEALKYVEEVIIRRQVGGGEWARPQWRPNYEFREMTPDDKLKAYNFSYKDDSEVTNKDLEAIGRYITRETLAQYNCRVLKSYEYCSYSEKHKRDVVHKFIATEDYPIFVFDYGDFKKLYKPHDQEKKTASCMLAQSQKITSTGSNNYSQLAVSLLARMKMRRILHPRRSQMLALRISSDALVSRMRSTWPALASTSTGSIPKPQSSHTTSTNRSTRCAKIIIK